MAKAPKATMPLEPIDSELPKNPYRTALERLGRGDLIDMPMAFDHPDLARASGSIISMKSLGKDDHDLEDFEIVVEGRTGKRLTVKLLEHHVMIYHTFSESDEDVAIYRKARGLK